MKKSSLQQAFKQLRLTRKATLKSFGSQRANISNFEHDRRSTSIGQVLKWVRLIGIKPWQFLWLVENWGSAKPDISIPKDLIRIQERSVKPTNENKALSSSQGQV